MRSLLTLLFLACGLTAAHAQYFDTLHINYDIGVSLLQSKDKQVLDSLAGNIAGRKLLIYSYADYLGSERPNLHLSDNRALLVKNYLLKKGVSPELIMECTGLGRVPGSGGREGDPRNRRTDIFVRRINPPVTTTAAATPVAPATPAQPATITRINLDTLKVDDVLRMEHISFVPGQAVVREISYPELANLYQLMYDHPSLKIKLEGHVCCCVYPDGFVKGTPDWRLSEDRAYMVYRYLVKKGIDGKRMLWEGFGRTRPIFAHETTSEEGQINRRVEIRILAK